jgi:formylglycine-generating enzyme
MKYLTLTLSMVGILMLSAYSPPKKKNDKKFAIKTIDKQMRLVSDNLYASAYEVSNSDYKFFLGNVSKVCSEIEDVTDLLPDTSAWTNLGNPPFLQAMVDNYFSHPAYANYPINNITSPQAGTYCDWLTKKYNSSEKRKYRKVQFRLPSEEEWILAARGGLDMADYPHGNIYLRNTKGNYLYNFLAIRESYLSRDTESGEIIIVKDKLGNECVNNNIHFTSPVDLYWPNEFGLYNMSGNVAEMVKEEGIAKGGSFNDPGYDIRIQSVKIYDKADPRIGFRVFMEVIKE